MIGETISHYRILEQIGSGGMGVVYKAEDTRIGSTVALKFLPPELTGDIGMARRFIREAQAGFGLEHPNICNVHEIDETEDGRLFICMSYYTGASLRERVAQGPVPAEEAIRIALGVASGLSRAHGEGVVHRDIKPGNIFLTAKGEVKILDFGLAKLAGGTRVTQTGTSLGTVAYMSPEQASGSDVDERSDIFSLGAVLYELVTGRAPFRADNPAGLIYQVLNDEPEPIRDRCPDCPPGLQRVVDKALRKNPDNRYQKASEFESDLQRVLEGIAPTAPFRHQRRRFARPTVLLTSLVGVVAVLSLTPIVQDGFRNWLMRFAEPSTASVAVLPLENVGGDPASQVFCDGLVETLTSKLTQMEQFHGSLWVVPASEVRQREIQSASEAGMAFGVNLAITGSVQTIDERLRLAINLVSLVTDPPRQVNSWMTDIEMTEIALLQDQTVVQMARMLDLELAPPEQGALAAGNTLESEAFEAYVVGRGYLQRYEKAEHIDLAIANFEKAVSRDRGYALAHAGLGQAYWIKYETTKDPQWIDLALESCDRAATLNDQLAPVHVTLGIVNEGRGNYDEALRHFQRATELEPGNSDAYRGLARTYADLGRNEEAEATYQSVIESKPDFWIPYNELGRFYYRLGRYDDAVEQFGQVGRLTPNNVWAWVNQGAVLYYLERWEEAAEMFRRAIDLEPTSSAYNNLAVLEYIQGHYEEAARVYRQALDLDNRGHSTWAGLANSCYWIPGKRPEASEAYRRARELALEQLSVNPRDTDLMVSLASYDAMLGNGEAAKRRMREALEADPEDVYVVYWAAHTYECMDERDEAVRWMVQALEMGYPPSEVLRDPFMQEIIKDARLQEPLAAGSDDEGP